MLRSKILETSSFQYIPILRLAGDNKLTASGVCITTIQLKMIGVSTSTKCTTKEGKQNIRNDDMHTEHDSSGHVIQSV